MTTALPVGAALLGLLLGPWLAAVTVRLAGRDDAAVPSRRRIVLTALLAAAALAAAPALAGARPAVVALGWLGAAAVVLAGVDLASHRLPNRVVFPAAAACAAALLADAVVTGTWPALARSVAAAAVTFAVAAGAATISPEGLGFGDVKLLGLLGLVLGWAGWGVLLLGVLAGLVLGAVGSLLLLATRRAGWRTAVPFGPPLLAGACLALAVGGPLPVP
ncbi:prepilin peptidase [Modestobacter lapidis]|nr:peptidase A24 [Modestobacter lapidis]